MNFYFFKSYITSGYKPLLNNTALKNSSSKTRIGVLSLPVCLKKLPFSSSEKDFSHNYCVDPVVAHQHYPDTGFMDQEYDRC
jgi:hypothetical protein